MISACHLILMAAVLLVVPTVQANVLQQLDVTRGDKDNTLIALTLQDKAVVTQFEKKADSLQVVLKASTLAKSLAGTDVSVDKRGAVKQLAVAQQGEDVVLTATARGPFDYDYYQHGNRLTVEIFPFAALPQTPAPAATERGGNSKISINFQDIPVRSVLQMVADHNGFNLVVSDTVQGSLTLRLEQVPWQKALDTILSVKGLDKRQVGNILLVAPKAELDEQERLVLEKRRQERELASLRSEVIKIKYANADDLEKMLGGGRSEGGGVSLLSERGSLAVDSRTNALVIKDLAENIEVVKSLIRALDIPIEQVEIEARIVTVDEGTLDEIGVRWGIANRNGSFSTGGSIEGNLGWENGIGFDDNSGDFINIDGAFSSETGNIDDFLNVNLGAVSPNAASIAFQVANLGKNLLLDLELSALQAESKAEIISSPRLLTTNKRPAYIEQGTELPYLEASSSGAASVAYKKAVLSLSVTPQITPDKKLVLDLKVTQDKPAGTVKAGTGEAMAINTQRIGTQVLVNDGETVVLGGIYQHEMMEGVDKIPLLGDIPGLGQLFRRNYETTGKRELLIFVTPRIMTR